MPSELLPTALDRRLVNIYRSWHALEHATRGIEIIDFDLATPHPVPPARDREEVARVLTELLGEANALADVPALVRQRLVASLTYLRALDGEQVDITEYIYRTLGTRPIVISEEEILAKRDAVGAILEMLRPLHRGDGPLRFRSDDFHRFQSLFLVPNPGNLPRLFEFYRDKWLPPLVSRLDVPFDPSMVAVEFASEDAYWKNWISGNLAEHRVVLRINYHPRHTWYQGSPEALVLHEYCGHAVQMVSWHRRIMRGDLPQFFGILTVHFPDQFILEGLAESLVYALPNGNRLEPKTEVVRDLHDHSLMVWNNVHLLANEEGGDAAEAYAMKHLPFGSREGVQAEIRDRTQHPLFRSYLYVYGIGQRAFLNAFKGLNVVERWRLLRHVYEQPMTPDEFVRLGAKTGSLGRATL
jgi:hypothetical protein